MRIAILGAGITGLTVGYRLRRVAPDVDFVIFEAADHWGGLIRSRVVEGFTYDLAGGHILYTKRPDIRRHMYALLQGQVVESRRETRIYYRGRYIRYPFENGLGDLPREDNFRCLKGYVDAYVARKTGTAPPPGNFREWILWRFGPGMAECFMFPYNEKLWKSDLRDMSFFWVGGRVPDAPPDDVLKSALGIPTEGYTHQLHFAYPRRGGFQALADATAAPIRDRIRLATPVREIHRQGGGWRVNGEPFDRVLSTLPLQKLADLVPDLPADLAADLRSFEHVGLLCFLIGLDYPTRFPYSWVYLPHPDHGPANRITHLSNYSPENAPPGCSSIMAEVTFRGPPPDPEGTLQAVVSALARLEILDADRIRVTDWARMDHAYPFFDLDFEERLARVRAALDALGLDTLGRTGRLEYFNTDHCIAAAFDYVDRLLAQPDRRPTKAPARP